MLLVKVFLGCQFLQNYRLDFLNQRFHRFFLSFCESLCEDIAGYFLALGNPIMPRTAICIGFCRYSKSFFFRETSIRITSRSYMNKNLYNRSELSTIIHLLQYWCPFSSNILFISISITHFRTLPQSCFCYVMFLMTENLFFSQC